MHRSILLAPILTLFAINTLADGTTFSTPAFPPPPGDFQAAVPKLSELSNIPMPSPSIYSPIPEIDPAFSSQRPRMIDQATATSRDLGSMSQPAGQMLPGIPDVSASMPSPWAGAPDASNTYQYAAPPGYAWGGGLSGYDQVPALPTHTYADPWIAQPNAAYVPYPGGNSVYPPMMQGAYTVMPQVIYEWVPISPAYETLPYGIPWQGQQPAGNYESNATFRPPQMQGTP